MGIIVLTVISIQPVFKEDCLKACLKYPSIQQNQVSFDCFVDMDSILEMISDSGFAYDKADK